MNWKKKKAGRLKKAFSMLAAQPNKRSSRARSEGEVDNSPRSHAVPDGRGSPFSCFVGGDLEVTSTRHRVDSRVQTKPDNKMGGKKSK